MKRTFVRFALACILLIPTSFSLFAAVEHFTLDNQHSYVLFKISHLGFSIQTGKWYANGSLELDQDKPENSKVNATIKVADVVTGIPELDKHLKSKLFFDVEKFPEARFVSNKVTMINKNQAKVEGILTLHGVDKPVTLDVNLNKVGKSPIADRMTAGFTATTDIKRSDYGMNAYLPDLGDEVKIEIDAEAYLTPEDGATDANKKQ